MSFHDLKNLPIGVFDSGMGGLTVLRALQAMLPSESYLYLGDTARLPYGTKSPETVRLYAIQMAKILVERGIKALVIACNTATTASLEYLQALMPDLFIMGVVKPGAEAAVNATRNGKIAVLATETTLLSGAYQLAILERKKDALVKVWAAGVLVALAEEGMKNNAITKAALQHYCDVFQEEDTLLLGCTHFPIFKDALKAILKPEVFVVDSAEATALALKVALSDKNLMQDTSSKTPMTHYLVTDSKTRFQKVGAHFLGHALASEAIQLIDGHQTL